MLSPTLIIIIAIVVVIFLLIFALQGVYRKVPQSKAVVVTGMRKRVITGGGGIIVPLFERTDVISLENMEINIRTAGALTMQGVGITAEGVAVIKVKSDQESIFTAVEQFNTGNEKSTIDKIAGITKNVLEGKLREIVSKLTVEEIYRDREGFAAKVQEVVATDLVSLGLELKAFTIKDISDENGYLDALGKARIAEVKRDADIAVAEAERETKIRTSEATQLGEAARLEAETKIAEASKDKELKVQAYQKAQATAKADADLAYEIQKNISNKEVTTTSLEVELLRKEKETEIQKREADRKQQELEASVNKEADAALYKAQKEAEAKKYATMQEAEARNYATVQDASGKADAIRLEGQARAEAIKATTMAEAEGMQKKAQAYKEYGDAAVTQMIIERLPEIARAIAEPLSKTEKIVVIDSGNGAGGGAAKITGYVTDIMATLPQTVQALTGYDLNDVFKKIGKLTSDESSCISKESNNKVNVVAKSDDVA